MSRPNWKHIQPRSLQHAFELCAEYALAKKRLTKDRIAEVMGQSQTWTLYKWIEKASMPANLIGAYELICGASYVTSYLAASNHKLLTATAAVTLLGEDYRFETTVLREGNALILRGGGDPSLQVEDLEALASEIDPECAMCWWGVALANGPNINAGMSDAQNREAVTALKTIKEAIEDPARMLIDL